MYVNVVHHPIDPGTIFYFTFFLYIHVRRFLIAKIAAVCQICLSILANYLVNFILTLYLQKSFYV